MVWGLKVPVGRLTDATRQQALAVVDQTAWGAIANEVIGHRAAEIARFGDPGEVDEIPHSVAAERRRKQGEAVQRNEEEAKRARTPTISPKAIQPSPQP